MSQKEGFNLYIDKVLKTIISNDNLMKLLYYKTENALEQPNLTQEQKVSLIYNKIFPYSFIPNITEEESSYLNMSFKNFKQLGNSRCFQAGKIMFFINCHKGLWQTNSGLRPICMFNEITNMFANSEDLGIGDLKFVGSDESWYDKNIGGYYISYEILDFSQNS